MNEAATVNPSRARSLRLERFFDAPRELVFAAWTDRKHFSQWCAPAKFEIVDSRVDARRGGIWWSVMRAPDGEECRAGGVYREVVEPQRLVFTYAHELPNGDRGPETLVTVKFEALGKRTKITLQQATFDTVEDRIAHDMGWSECLDRLATLLGSTQHM